MGGLRYGDCADGRSRAEARPLESSLPPNTSGGSQLSQGVSIGAPSSDSTSSALVGAFSNLRRSECGAGAVRRCVLWAGKISDPANVPGCCSFSSGEQPAVREGRFRGPSNPPGTPRGFTVNLTKLLLKGRREVLHHVRAMMVDHKPADIQALEGLIKLLVGFGHFIDHLLQHMRAPG